MIALITGGAGFIGTHVARRLLELGHSVRAVDLKEPRYPVEGVEYHLGDIRDDELMKKVIQGVEVVYHFAAIVSVPVCQQDPVESYSTNTTGTLKVLEAIRHEADRTQSSPARIVFASTAALYGHNGDDGRALKETDIADEFMSFYAGQKVASENMIQLYRDAYGVPGTIFRFFNVFGPGQDPTSPYSGVITIFCTRAAKDQDMLLFGGGEQTRDFVSVYDIADACTSVLELPREKWRAKPMNLGTSTKLTVRKLAEMIRETSQTSGQIQEAPFREGDVVHSLSDTTRARTEIGYDPKRTLEAELPELYRFLSRATSN